MSLPNNEKDALAALTGLISRHPVVHTNGQWAPIEYCGCNRWDSDGSGDRHSDHLARVLKRWLAAHDRQVRSEGWDEGADALMDAGDDWARDPSGWVIPSNPHKGQVSADGGR